jgi:hypothetical protein
MEGYPVKLGDLILVKEKEKNGVVVLPGTRFSQGIIVESQPKYGVVMVRWCDGMLHLEEMSRIEKYYQVISNETR